jgi:dihydrolipoamide dehydrogenase
MPKSITIIGGGPGGYVAAIRAAQLGAQVTLFEKATLGGTCLNRGCVPTKVLLETAEIFATVKNAKSFGVLAENISLDFSEINKRKQTVVNQLVEKVATLLGRREKQINIIKGVGTLLDSKTVGILGGSEKIRSDNIIIATGSKPSRISIPDINTPGVITSDEALSMERFPKDVVIVGGGVVGLEFAQIMSRMGSKVTIIEIMPRILPAEDEEISNVLKAILMKEGIEIFTSTVVTNVKMDKQGRSVISFSKKEGTRKEERSVDKILLAAGRVPCVDDLGLDKLGVACEQSKILVNERMATNIPGVYAIGDVRGGAMLAHVAMEEGKCAAENCMGANRNMDYRAVPRCVYTSPEVAGVGLTEKEARDEHGEIKVGRYPFTANSKAFIQNETKGMVKIIADAIYGQILGVQIIGSQAIELIAGATLAVKMEATFEDIASTIHPHPAMSEALMEAASGMEGKAIHI